MTRVDLLQDEDQSRTDLTPPRRERFKSLTHYNVSRWLPNALGIGAAFGVGIEALRTTLLYARASTLLLWYAVFADDSFYYLKVAKNIVAGYGPSFDGIESTNGYQPLWEWILVFIGYISRASEFVHNAVLLQSVMYALTAVLIVFYVKLIGRSWIAGTIAGFFYASNFLLMKNALLMMENGLQFVLLMAFLVLWQLWMKPVLADVRRLSRVRFCCLSALLFLISLVRLDALIFTVIVGVLVLRASRLHIRTMLFFTPTAVGLATYLLINEIQFGNISPVSGVVKHDRYNADFINSQHGIVQVLYQYWRAALEALGYLNDLTYQAITSLIRTNGALRSWSIIAVLLLILGALVHLLEVSPQTRLKNCLASAPTSSLTILVAYFPLHIALMSWYLTVFVRGSSWYFSGEILGLTIVPAVVVGWCIPGVADFRKLGRAHPKPWTGVAGRWIVSAVVASGGWMVLSNYFDQTLSLARYETTAMAIPKSSDRDLQYQLAMWMSVNLPKSARVASWDAGALGWFTQNHSVTNVDGLVNNFAFYRCCLASPARDDNLPRYLETLRIDYIADFMFTKSTAPSDIVDTLEASYGFAPGQLTVVWRRETNYHAPFEYINNKSIPTASVDEYVYLVRIDSRGSQIIRPDSPESLVSDA